MNLNHYKVYQADVQLFGNTLATAYTRGRSVPAEHQAGSMCCWQGLTKA
jgi:hypothetical protein